MLPNVVVLVEQSGAFFVGFEQTQQQISRDLLPQAVDHCLPLREREVLWRKQSRNLLVSVWKLRRVYLSLWILDMLRVLSLSGLVEELQNMKAVLDSHRIRKSLEVVDVLCPGSFAVCGLLVDRRVDELRNALVGQRV